MRWLQSEYILKGIYLGLLLFVAVEAPDWPAVQTVGLFTLGGLLLALAVAAVSKLREGYQVQGRVVAFVLFLLLESPTLVYAGVLLGMALGAYTAVPRPEEGSPLQLTTAVAGGALLGVLFGLVRDLKKRELRLALSLLLGAGVVVGLLYWFGWFGQFGDAYKPSQQLSVENPTLFGVFLLLGMPIFYLLTFVGLCEESEVEIGASCALLGLGLAVLTQDHVQIRTLAFLLPVAVYFVYTLRVMPGLRVFKHTLRGLSFAQVRRYRQALLAFRRALQLDPRNQLARESLWSVHRALDLHELVKDPQTLALVDLDMCLERAASLLVQPGPAEARLKEAHRLLDLILNQRPAMKPRLDYWRAVARTHERQLDQAAELLAALLDPTQHHTDDHQRRAVLLPAWQLALTLQEQLRQRVGLPQLALPGRRIEAIAAVERQLLDVNDDPDAWALKRVLYQDLAEAEYAVAAANGPPAEFDHLYAHQLGLALIADPARWERGAEYLRMAAAGLPQFASSIFIQIAQAHQRAGDVQGMWQNYERAKQVGRAVGPKNMSDEDRHTYYATLKTLGEAAEGRGDLAAALENYNLYSEYERSGLETLRTLADLFERHGDPISAAHATEKALVYNSKDADLIQRKDKYYYSILPEQLRGTLDVAKPWFDTAYALKKAKSLLDAKGSDLDLVDWAYHLVQLVQIVQPESIAARMLTAQAQLRRGERDDAVALLEHVHANRPEKFPSTDEEDAWYRGCQLLGKLCLEELGRPDLAVTCFQDFRKSPKSGADTLYRLGQAYEQIGDVKKAKHCYEHVASYDGHPLVYEARNALHRLQAG